MNYSPKTAIRSSRASLAALHWRGVETACEIVPGRTTKRNTCFVERATHATAFAVELPAHGSGTVTLRMEQTPFKTLSMALSALQSPYPTFSVGGTIECNSPYGWIVIPVHLEDQAF